MRIATWFLALLLVGAFGAVPVARAQDEDLPGRVGRIADFAGKVFLSPEDRAGDWDEAELNATIVSGDNVWVEPEGRLEIDYGGGQVRLAGDTNINVARLDDRTITLFVAQGRALLRVRVLDPGDVARIDTPNAQFEILRPGLYRVDVSPDRRQASLVVREGEANVQLPSGVWQVLPGQTADVSGADDAVATVRNGYFTDGFDTWSANRDRRYERSRTATYVSRQMIGYADLDEYGRWQTYPQYGAVWFPEYVVADWAPYRYGRWDWVSAYGWSWVDDAPWGYAPFHYGRWVYVSGRWGWCPGAFVPRPVWAPALVAWYGGPSWSFSATVGGPVYGWVPLGWGDPYIPAWQNCSSRCWTRYNRPYAVNYAERPHAPPTHYANRDVPGAVTAVAGATFVGRQPVHRNTVPLTAGAFANAPVLGAAPMLTRPSPTHVPGATAGGGRTPPPASTFYPAHKPLMVTPGAGGLDRAPRTGVNAVPGASAIPPGGAPSAGPKPLPRASQPAGAPMNRQAPAGGAPLPRTGAAAVPGTTAVPPATAGPPHGSGMAKPLPQGVAPVTPPAAVTPSPAPAPRAATPRPEPVAPAPLMRSAPRAEPRVAPAPAVRSAPAPVPGAAKPLAVPPSPAPAAIPPAPQPRGMPQPSAPMVAPRPSPNVGPVQPMAPPPAPPAPAVGGGGPPHGAGGPPVRQGGAPEGKPMPKGDPNAPQPVPR